MLMVGNQVAYIVSFEILATNASFESYDYHFLTFRHIFCVKIPLAMQALIVMNQVGRFCLQQSLIWWAKVSKIPGWVQGGHYGNASEEQKTREIETLSLESFDTIPLPTLKLPKQSCFIWNYTFAPWIWPSSFIWLKNRPLIAISTISAISLFFTCVRESRNLK